MQTKCIYANLSFTVCYPLDTIYRFFILQTKKNNSTMHLLLIATLSIALALICSAASLELVENNFEDVFTNQQGMYSLQLFFI